MYSVFAAFQFVTQTEQDADSRKDDNYQRFAAYTSCEFCKFLVEKHLPDRNLTDI